MSSAVPTSRAVFHAALVLLFFLDSRRVHAGPSPPPLIVDSSLDVDWPLLAQICWNAQGMAYESDPAGGSQTCQPPSAMDYVSNAGFGLSIQSFTEGTDFQLDSDPIFRSFFS
jgi:hypothetical protein